MKVSLRDIGDHLGISHSTVSRALRNDPRISKEMRKAVQAACKELGYKPNSIISDLAAARWKMDKVAEGSIIAYINRTGAGTLAGAGYDRHVVAAAAKLGYQVAIFSRQNFSSSTKLQRILRSRGITDIILGPVYEEEFVVELDWEKFICVQLLPGFLRLPLHSVATDHFEGMVMAWRKAVSCGYRRIGTILFDHPFWLMDDVKRESAVESCQKRISPELEAIPPFHYSANDLRIEAMATWVKTHRLDAVIGFNDTYYGFLPLEMGPIGYAVLNKGITKEVAGVSVPTEAFAEEAVNLLHYCRRTYQWGIPKQRIDHVIEPVWYEGNSLPMKVMEGIS